MSDANAISQAALKLGAARRQFHQMKLKKSGWNAYSKYAYFELGDFLIPAMDCLYDNGLVPIVSFSADVARLDLIDTEGEGTLCFTSPMARAELKAAHDIQNLGAVETYQRRYLYMMLMEIVEHDAVDSGGMDHPEDKAPPPEPKKVTKKVAKKTASKPAADTQAEVDAAEWAVSIEEAENNLETAEQAREVVAMMLQLADKMHSESRESLVGFWKTNASLIDYLDQNWSDAYEELKQGFTALKQRLSD